jgi:hypothetical protein
MREYVYLWHRFIDINVGTQDTAADEMLTKKMALKISGTIASHWLVINKSESHTNFLSFTLNEIVIEWHNGFSVFYPLVICARKNWFEIKTDSFQQTIVLKTQKHSTKYSLKCVMTISFRVKLRKFVWLSDLLITSQWDAIVPLIFSAIFLAWSQTNFYVHRWREGKKPKSHYVILHPYQLDALHPSNACMLECNTSPCLI